MPFLGPIDQTTHRRLREAVLLHRERESRRRFAPRLYVGLPGADTLVHECDTFEDTALVTDLVAAMLQRVGGHVRAPWVWLARPGELSLHDEDVRWGGPALRACEQARLPTTFFVVTRDGWWDPVTGACHRWRRLRRSVPRRSTR
jgi:hypothetical protein